MRRLLALAVVAAFLAGPTHRLMCLIACDDAQHVSHVAQTEDCHSDSSTGPTLGAGADHCGAEATPAAFTAKRAGTKAPNVVSPLDDRSVVPTLELPGLEATLAAAIVPSPPARLLIPLRI